MLLSLLLACTPYHNLLLSSAAPGEHSLDVDLSAVDPAPSPGEPGLTYEVYVRSFQDSDGDGIGDLAGLRARLPHLASLDVRTVWLMPVFPAFGPAGYDVTDFDTVTPEYGTEADLVALVEDAHALGMRVLLDVPFNHVHTSHAWFVAAESGDVDARARFVYADDGEGENWHPSAAGGEYFAWFGADMPDLNWRDADTRRSMTDSLGRWLDLGVDGYRFDAVLMLDEGGEEELGSAASHELLGELVEELRGEHPDRFFLAEASEWEPERTLSWLDAEGAPGVDAVLDFPRLDALEEAGNGRGTAALADMVADAVDADGALGLGAFAGSHDLDRLPARVTDPAARRAVRVAQFLLPGSPVLYYGEELDLADATTALGQDYPMRAPMPWSTDSQAGFTTGTPWFTPDPSYADGVNVADEEGDPASMLTLIRDLGAIREAYGLDSTSTWQRFASEDGVLHFSREGEAGTIEVWVNLTPETHRFLEPWGYRVW